LYVVIRSKILQTLPLPEGQYQYHQHLWTPVGKVNEGLSVFFLFITYMSVISLLMMMMIIGHLAAFNCI